jgi:hypothetical protein
MKTYTDAQAITEITKNRIDLSETDNGGQIVIYTGLYRWSDNTIRTEMEPGCGEESDEDIDD